MAKDTAKNTTKDSTANTETTDATETAAAGQATGMPAGTGAAGPAEAGGLADTAPGTGEPVVGPEDGAALALQGDGVGGAELVTGEVSDGGTDESGVAQGEGPQADAESAGTTAADPAAGQSLEPAGTDGGDDAEGATEPVRRIPHGFTDDVVKAAGGAAFNVLDTVVGLREVPDAIYERCNFIALGEDPAPANALAAFIRRIGRDRATPDVVAQQLRILRYWDKAESDPLELLIVKVFATTLCDLDDYEAVEARQLEALTAPVPSAVPIAIEETTMELVDDPMATVGGQG